MDNQVENQNATAVATEQQPTTQSNNNNATPSTNPNTVNNKEGLKAASTMQSKRKRFKYKIQNDKGKITSGFLDAYNQAEVTSYLKNEG